jgi:hypothetical protein
MSEKYDVDDNIANFKTWLRIAGYRHSKGKKFVLWKAFYEYLEQ